MSDHRNKQLNELAKQYAEKATLLSNRIQEFDKYLGTIEAIVSVDVKLEGYRFGIKRLQAGWVLTHLVGNSWDRVTDAPVHIKMHAAKAASMLLDQMMEKQLKAVKELDTALEQFDKTFTRKEG